MQSNLVRYHANEETERLLITEIGIFLVEIIFVVKQFMSQGHTKVSTLNCFKS